MRKILYPIFSCILWIQILISHCECPGVNDSDKEDSVTENPVDNDPAEEEYVFQCENVVQSPLHTFKEGSRPYKVQASLGYLGKPYWPSQWIMVNSICRMYKLTVLD